MTFGEKLTELKPQIFESLQQHLSPQLLKRLKVKSTTETRVKIRMRRELAASLGVSDFNTRDETFSAKKPYTPPPSEPPGAFEKLLKIAEDKTNKLRSDAALSLLNMLILARIERQFL